jgi:hypothetical protein
MAARMAALPVLDAGGGTDPEAGEGLAQGMTDRAGDALGAQQDS